MSFRALFIFQILFTLNGIRCEESGNLLENSSENSTEISSDECWPSTIGSESCIIEANITLNSGFSIPIQFKCFDELIWKNHVEENMMKRRFMNTSKVELDGCKVPSKLYLKNFRLEFIPNITDTLNVLKIKRFDFDVLKTEIFQNFTILNELSLENNEIDSLFIHENVNLKQVKTLKLRNNRIGFLSFAAFEHLEELLWENEESVYLKIPTFLKKIPLKSIMFKNIKLPHDLFSNFPTTLEKLLITEMKFSKDNSSLFLQNNGVMKFIVIVDNDLPKIKLQENLDIPTVEFLNLSGNCLHEVILRNFSRLKELDLSRNRLSALEKESFRELQNLEMLFLNENNLIHFHLNFLEKSITSLSFVDISHNKIMKIGLNGNFTFNEEIKIKVDGNELNCEWLQKFFLKYPERFQVFQYEKFTSKININGLECFSNCLNENETQVLKMNATHTQVVQQLAIESLGKKNQRAEALIIIIMLPLGVAFLSILLFLWIKCQKIFHRSFYRTLPLIGGSPDRFDVVRHIPPTQDYEIPLTCGNVHHDGPDFKCSQNCNLNYEEFPGKEEIYQEIPGDKVVNNIHYDHLSREQ